MLWVALTGFALGFFGSVPLAGPVAILVMARSVDGHVRWAIAAGLGAGLGEAGFAFLAYVSYDAFLANHPMVESIARVLTVVILLVLAVVLMRSKPPGSEPSDKKDEAGGVRGGFAAGFLVSVCNPTLILTWTAVLSMLAGVEFLDLSTAHAVPFAISVGIGISIWFALAAVWIGKRRARFSPRIITVIYRSLAVLAFLLAIGATISLLT